ncbi:phosphatase PAP2 family protein [Cupriavidus oxalaticus]
MTAPWSLVIWLGESSWVLPLAAAIALWLAAAGQWLRALRWAATLGAGAALILAGKLAFELGGWSWPAAGLYSISGHAMLTTATYPVLLMLAGGMLGARGARGGWLAGLAVSVVMGVALVAGYYHTLSETLAGAAVGLAVAACNTGAAVPLRLGRAALLLAASAALALMARFPQRVDAARDALQARSAERLGISQQYSRRIHVDPDSGRTVVTVLRPRA